MLYSDMPLTSDLISEIVLMGDDVIFVNHLNAYLLLLIDYMTSVDI
jgi:hypothetical protein